MYRMALEEVSMLYFSLLFEKYQPTLAVNETIPAVGGGNFAVATQSYLANCVVTCFHVCATLYDVECKQLSARTVQSAIAIRGNSKGITKVQVRNGVIARIPELKPRIKLLVADETDAIAIGLCALDKFM